jgi:hypothetical protein
MPFRRAAKGNFRWHCKILICDTDGTPRLLGHTKPLLFAPRLMLERGLQFTERRSHTAQRRLITPFFARFRLRNSQMEPAQSRLILPRINDA